jgi:hypothetical protein
MAFGVACGSSPPAGPLGNAGPRFKKQTFTVAIVVSGWELWMGNDLTGKLDPDDPSLMKGAWPELREAFETANLAANPGSQGMLILYADKAVAKVPMGPIERLTPDVLGRQVDYFGSVGHELVAGVRLAAAHLLREQRGRKYLIVIGDGVDTNPEAARTQLSALRRELEAANVETISIVYRTKLSFEHGQTTLLTDEEITVGAVEDLGAAIAKVFDRLPR